MSVTKTITTSKPFYVVAGAGDLAVKTLRDGTDRLSTLRIERKDIETTIASLQSETKALPGQGADRCRDPRRGRRGQGRHGLRRAARPRQERRHAHPSAEVDAGPAASGLDDRPSRQGRRNHRQGRRRHAQRRQGHRDDGKEVGGRHAQLRQGHSTTAKKRAATTKKTAKSATTSARKTTAAAKKATADASAKVGN